MVKGKLDVDAGVEGRIEGVDGVGCAQVVVELDSCGIVILQRIGRG